MNGENTNQFKLVFDERSVQQFITPNRIFGVTEVYQATAELPAFLDTS